MEADTSYMNSSRSEHGRFKRVMWRKKVCTSCGRLLWRKDFYARCNNTISSECKECCKAKMRKAYKPKHKDGIYHDELGRPIEYKNGIKAYVWTPQMVSDLKRFYPVTKNEELADIFMMSAKTIWKKAKELGIEKDKAWLNKIRAENALIGGYAAKRKHKCIKKESLPITGKLV